MPDLERLVHWPGKISDHRIGAGRYMVLDDIDGVHRVWLRGASLAAETGCGFTYAIAPDAWFHQRMAAVRRLNRRLLGLAPERRAPGTFPTAFQRSRLVKQLAILDELQQTGGGRTSVRALAGSIVYQNMAALRAADWQTSSQRKGTQRMISEALKLMNGGYRGLLKAGAVRWPDCA